MTLTTVPSPSSAEAVLPLGWCPEEDTRHNVIARRNVLAALWAGSLMGLKGDALTRYAVEVHSADYRLPGDDDIVDKLSADLSGCGIAVNHAQVRAHLKNCHRQALLQLLATD